MEALRDSLVLVLDGSDRSTPAGFPEHRPFAEAIWNQVKVSKSGAVCLRDMARQTWECHGVRVESTPRESRCATAGRLLSIRAAERRARTASAGGAKERGSDLLLGLDGISRSHVVAGDVAFLSGVDGASLPPVAFTAGSHNSDGNEVLQKKSTR